MTNEQNDYEYWDDLDILYVNSKFSNDKFFGNIVFNNIVLDVAENGKVIGVEIDCASKVFNISPQVLKNLKSAEIKVVKVGDTLSLGIFLATPVEKHSFQFAVMRGNSSKVPVISC